MASPQREKESTSLPCSYELFLAKALVAEADEAFDYKKLHGSSLSPS
jgi:hypothetical protein